MVAITEDHCDVAPDWCEQVLDAHARHPDAVAIAGAGHERRPRSTDGPGELLPRARSERARERRTARTTGFRPRARTCRTSASRSCAVVQRPGDLELVVTPQLWAQGLLGFDENVRRRALAIDGHRRARESTTSIPAGLTPVSSPSAGRRCAGGALARDAVALPRRLARGRRSTSGVRFPATAREIRRLVPADQRPRDSGHRRLSRRHRGSWAQPAPGR